MSEIGEVQFVFLLLLLFVVAFGVLARKVGTPYPIVMVIGGLLLGLIPGIPPIVLNPDLIFLIILPPLLYAAAWTTSWREFRYNFISIFLLAFALVAFTVVGVAWMAPSLMLGFDWRLGLVLGAVVAPTDAIAATSIARRVGLPSRIVDILEGESLLNDASGLLALQFAVALVVGKQVPTIAGGILTFAWLTIGGIAFGLLAGWILDFVERRIDDGPIEIALSILVPYAVYLAADRAHASGVLAVVACGLFLSRRSASFFSPAVRLGILELCLEWISLCDDWLAASVDPWLNPRLQPSISATGRGIVQPIPNSAQAHLGLPRLRRGLVPAYTIRTPKGEAAAPPAGIRLGMDGHARRSLSCCRSGPPRRYGRWQRFPSTQLNRFSHVLRNLRHPRGPGTYVATPRPFPRLGRNSGSES
jgi:hypothetical protein